MRIVFAANKGYFGEHYMVRISCIRWLIMKLDRGYVTRVRIIKKGNKNAGKKIST